MDPHRYDLIQLETQPRTISLLPSGYGTEHGAGISLEWLSTATDERPARLRATLTNHNEFRAKFQTHSLPPFNSVVHTRLQCEPRSALYLAPTETSPLVDEHPVYEQRSSGQWHAIEVPPKQPSSHWLDPDESITGEYYLLGGKTGDGLDTGRYPFESTPRGTGFSLVVWDTERPGPSGQSKFTGKDVPTFADSGILLFSGTERMGWFHETDPATEVYVEPTSEEVVIPGRIDFTVVNHSQRPLDGNPAAWELLKLHDGRWFHIEPSVIAQPGHTLSPGATRTEPLRAFAGEPVPCETGHDVGHLGGGRYAFTLGEYGDQLHAAVFDLLGDAVTVTASDAVEVTEHDADELTVRSTRGQPNSGGYRLGRYTLSRVRADGRDPNVVIAEQVLRQQPLRDALGLMLAHEVTTVSIQEYTASYPPFGVKGTEFVEYDGETYRITVEATASPRE